MKSNLKQKTKSHEIYSYNCKELFEDYTFTSNKYFIKICEKKSKSLVVVQDPLMNISEESIKQISREGFFQTYVTLITFFINYALEHSFPIRLIPPPSPNHIKTSLYWERTFYSL